MDRNKWVHRKSLPSRYRNYNLYQGQKIVINRPTPYLQHSQYQANYSRPNVRHQKFDRNDKRGYSKYDKHDNRKKDRNRRY